MNAEGPPAVALPGEAALRIVLETALDPVVVMRSDGTVVEWSTQAETAFGWTRQEAVGRQMAEMIIPERFRAEHYRGLRHYLETGQGPLLRTRTETMAVRRDGKEFPVELSVSPFEHGDGRLFMGFLRDITRRRQAQRVFKREARRATLLHQVTSLAAETNSVSDVLQLCLDAVCELTGWPVGHAYVPAEDGSLELVPTAIWHIEGDKFEQLRRATMEMRYRPGMGLPGYIWQTKELHWIPDVSRPEANFPRFRTLSELNVGSAFGVPIKSGDSVIAVLEFFTDALIERDPQVLVVARTFGEQVGRVLERREVLQRQQMQVAELNHRVKNMLAVVMALSMHTARSADSIELFIKSFSARLMSLARGYNLLTASEWKQTAIQDIVREIVAPHAGAHQLEYSGPQISLSSKATLTLSMILHELVTNAVKYGALSIPAGQIAVHWSLTEQEGGSEEIVLQWQESGLTGLEAPQDPSGFGSKLIETSARQDLGGRVQTTYQPEGIGYSFWFPSS
jgi:PAS domain S-box-containing protein